MFTEGLEKYTNNAFLVGDTPEIFAEHIVNLLSNIEFAEQLSKAGCNLIKNYNRKNIESINSILE